MSAFVLLTGTIDRKPEVRRSRNDDVFVATSLRVAESGGAVWWRIAAFAEGVQDELLRLDVGDACAIQGHMRVDRYEKDGEVRLGLACRVERVTALRPHDRGGAAKPSAGRASTYPISDDDDDVRRNHPF